MENIEKNRIQIDLVLNSYSTITENRGAARKIAEYSEFIKNLLKSCRPFVEHSARQTADARGLH